MRIHDARLGRFLSVDPLSPEYPELTPYQFASNRPIENIDLDGLEQYNYRLSIDEKNGKSQLQLVNVERPGVFGDLFTTQQVEYNGDFYHIHTEANYAPYDGFDKVLSLAGKTKPEIDAFFATRKTEAQKKADERQKSEDMYVAMATYGYLRQTLNARKTKENTRVPPAIKAQINSRHKLSSTALAKANKTLAATLAPEETLNADLKSYNEGSFSKAGGNVLINGNTYGLKNEGKTLYPINGKDFINVSAGQIQAIQFYKTKTGEGLTKALDGAGVSQSDRTFAQDFIKKYK